MTLLLTLLLPLKIRRVWWMNTIHVKLCFEGVVKLTASTRNYLRHTHLYCVLYQNGWSSLMLASHNGHMEVVDKLLQHGARVDLQNKV